MKKLTKTQLKKLELETTNEGFTLWINEKVNGRNVKHWLLDASLIMESGEISLGNLSQYKINIVYKEKSNRLVIIKK
jgi:hypothetical protein